MLHCSPSESGSAGGERTVFMAIGKQAIKLYWVTTADHDEDWFILAESARQARAYHEYYEGYDKGDARSRLIVSDVTLKEFQNGTPPCHAQFQDLFQIGFKNAGSIPNRRGVKFNGEIFREGILESIVELGRQELAVTLRENGGLGRKKVASSATEPEDAPGVEMGPRLVHQGRAVRPAQGCGGLPSERRGRVTGAGAQRVAGGLTSGSPIRELVENMHTFWSPRSYPSGEWQCCFSPIYKCIHDLLPQRLIQWSTVSQPRFEPAGTGRKHFWPTAWPIVFQIGRPRFKKECSRSEEIFRERSASIQVQPFLGVGQ
jgi:hypothetical protein